ncbi:hypothetical protein D3C85_1192180 [compost metagenome]
MQRFQRQVIITAIGCLVQISRLAISYEILNVLTREIRTNDLIANARRICEKECPNLFIGPLGVDPNLRDFIVLNGNLAFNSEQLLQNRKGHSLSEPNLHA